MKIIIATTPDATVADPVYNTGRTSSSRTIKHMRDFRSSIDCLSGGTPRNNKENMRPPVAARMERNTWTTHEKSELGFTKPPKARAAIEYDRSSLVQRPDNAISQRN